MKTSVRGFGVLVLAACGALAAVPSLRAQDGPAPGPQGEAPGDGEAEGGAQEAEALVRRIQESLAEVDAALQEAADEEVAADAVNTARRKHLEVIRDIEALIKQIKYQQSNDPSGKGSPSGKGGKGGKGAEGEAPKGGEAAPRPSDGSQTPKPTGGRDGTEPKDGEAGDQRRGSKPTGSEPDDGGPGGNEQGNRLPPEETGRFTRTDTDARWGLLPPKLQERLMNLHVDDVPERYRAWLEAYIRALNSREQAGSTR